MLSNELSEKSQAIINARKDLETIQDFLSHCIEEIVCENTSRQENSIIAIKALRTFLTHKDGLSHWVRTMIDEFIKKSPNNKVD